MSDKKTKHQTDDAQNKQIEELTKRLEEVENSWKRALADYQNLEKRFADERVKIVDYANSNLLGRLLSILDNLELTLVHGGDKGLELVVKEFKNILAEEGVTELSVLGSDFDSNQMDALEMIEGEQGKVIEVVRKGYLFKNKLLRPALVKVGNGKSN